MWGFRPDGWNLCVCRYIPVAAFQARAVVLGWGSRCLTTVLRSQSPSLSTMQTRYSVPWYIYCPRTSLPVVATTLPVVANIITFRSRRFKILLQRAALPTFRNTMFYTFLALCKTSCF